MKNQVICKEVLYLWLIDIISFFLLLFFSIKIIQQPQELLTKETTTITLDQATGGPPEQIIHEFPYTYEDLKYLSSIIYCEAGNQCDAGKQAVGIVVLNRVENEQFEDTIKEVIYQKGQFTPVSSGSINTALNMFESKELPQECISAAVFALEGNNTIKYNEQQYNIDYLYFCRSPKNAELQIEDHYFK